jgi:hypothetical protein
MIDLGGNLYMAEMTMKQAIPHLGNAINSLQKVVSNFSDEDFDDALSGLLARLVEVHDEMIDKFNAPTAAARAGK